MNRLKKLREQRGMTAQGLWAKARVSTATISVIELHDYYPQARVRKALAGALRCNESDIWPEGDPQRSASSQVPLAA